MHPRFEVPSVRDATKSMKKKKTRKTADMTAGFILPDFSEALNSSK
jgi:hypothetical protein